MVFLNMIPATGGLPELLIGIRLRTLFMSGERARAICKVMFVLLVLSSFSIPLIATVDGQEPTFDVVFSEVLYESGGRDSHMEYIEIFNSNDHSVNIEGWSIADNSDEFVFERVILEPNSFLLIARDSDMFNRRWSKEPDLTDLGLTLDNDGDQLLLSDGDGNLKDLVAWEKGEDGSHPGWILEADKDRCIRRKDVYDQRTDPSVWNSGQMPDPKNSGDGSGDTELAPSAFAVSNVDEIFIGESVIFDGKDSYDPDGEVLEYIWEFSGPDGVAGEASGEVVVREFEKPGTHDITLKVVDTDGIHDKASLLITVRGSEEDLTPETPDDEELPDGGPKEGDAGPVFETDEGDTPEPDEDGPSGILGTIILILLLFIVIFLFGVVIRTINRS